MRVVLPALVTILAAALPGGCGSSSEDSTGSGAPAPPATTATAPPGASAKSCGASSPAARALRASGLDCAQARSVASSWISKPACKPAAGASRSACTVGGYRCLATTTDRGHSVSCASRGRSLSFTVRL